MLFTLFYIVYSFVIYLMQIHISNAFHFIGISMHHADIYMCMYSYYLTAEPFFVDLVKGSLGL